MPKRFASTDVQILLRERYEQAYGIYDHLAVKAAATADASRDDHFALVRHHWSEDSVVASRLRERMEAFITMRVGHNFHISFMEFIELPTYVCDLMLEVLDKRGPGESQELQDLINEMKNQGKK